MLARWVEQGLALPRSRRLLERAVAWLFRAVPRACPRFAVHWPCEQTPDLPIAWCNGDLGIAAVLLRAGRARASQEIVDEALALLDPSDAVLTARAWKT